MCGMSLGCFEKRKIERPSMSAAVTGLPIAWSGLKKRTAFMRASCPPRLPSIVVSQYLTAPASTTLHAGGVCSGTAPCVSRRGVCEWFAALRAAYGGSNCRLEDKWYHLYSDTQPDMTRYHGVTQGKHVIYEQKVVCPISNGASGTGAHGATVAFGNTLDAQKLATSGLRASRDDPGVAGA